jgi:hypothetical protein
MPLKNGWPCLRAGRGRRFKSSHSDQIFRGSIAAALSKKTGTEALVAGRRSGRFSEAGKNSCLATPLSGVTSVIPSLKYVGIAVLGCSGFGCSGFGCSGFGCSGFGRSGFGCSGLGCSGVGLPAQYIAEVACLTMKRISATAFVTAWPIKSSRPSCSTRVFVSAISSGVRTRRSRPQASIRQISTTSRREFHRSAASGAAAP